MSTDSNTTMPAVAWRAWIKDAFQPFGGYWTVLLREPLTEIQTEPLVKLADAEAAIAALQREVEELRADKARLIEDRARFPDRPDDIGAMIGAHYNNLKATAKANEEAWRRAQRTADEHAIAAARYEVVRKLNPRQFADLWERNIKGGPQFDALVDELASKAEVPNG